MEAQEMWPAEALREWAAKSFTRVQVDVDFRCTVPSRYGNARRYGGVCNWSGHAKSFEDAASLLDQHRQQKH